MENISCGHIFDMEVINHELRKNRIADVADAINIGFKAEPDLATHHLPLLSDDALARVFTESERWRDKARERDLEAELLNSREAEKVTSAHYVRLREIIGAMDVPRDFMSIDLNRMRHISWTEQQAIELVKKAHGSEHNRKAAEIAEENLRWHAQRADAVRKLIAQYHCSGCFTHGVADALMDALLGRAQTGERPWTKWECGYTPKDITRDTKLEIKLTNDDVVILDSSVVEWSEVKEYRLAK